MPTSSAPDSSSPSDWRPPPVAIVGMAVLLPGAPDLETYWRNLVDGNDAIAEVPPGRWDPAFYDPRGASGPARADRIYCRRGGFVDEFAYADPLRFGIAPSDVRSIEPDQLLALRVAAAAIDDAGGPSRLGDPARVGVILGRGGYIGAGMARLDQRLRTAHQLVHTLGTLLPALGPDDLDQVRAAFTDQLGPEAPDAAMGIVPNLTAARIANRLDLGGPAFTVDAACASSLVAVDCAVSELASGRCDTVLAGGVHHCHDITLWSVFTQLRALSRAQRIRPFDRGADGTLIGEGTGVVVLRRLADAERDGDRVYAVIRGTGVSSDGRGGGLVSPDPAGQQVAVERAWRAAGLNPREPGAVGMIEAHGTATPAGDEAELTTLARVFGPGRDDEAAPGGLGALGSVKAMIGHAMAAAGVASLVKAALALHHRVLLPAVNCDDPHPAVAATRFRPLPAAVPWESAGPRRAGVNAFGFGGTNAHVLLEEASAAAAAASDGPLGAPARVAAGARVLDPPVSASPVSAPAAARLAGSVAATATVVEPELVLRLAAPTADELGVLLEVEDAVLRAQAATTPVYTGAGARLGLVNPTARRLASARYAVGGIRQGAWKAWRGRSEVWASAEPLLAGGDAGRTAFVFPGLEAEFSPRLDDVARHFGFAVTTDLSSADLGHHGTGVLLVSRLLDRVLRRMRVKPDALAGHSIGEWSAMFAAGMFDDDAVDADIFAADPYEGDVPDVDYASLACSSDQARQVLADYPEIVLSHDNAPQSSVVCGPPGAIADLAGQLRRKNVVVRVLPFRSGFHTPMLLPHLPALRARTDRLRLRRPARVELWSATTASPYPAGLEAVRELFVRHLVEPVLFRQTVEAMYAAGVRVFVQVGPGRLGGLIDGVLEDSPHLTIAANSAHRDGLGQLRRLAAALWVENGDPDFAALDEPSADRAGHGGQPGASLTAHAADPAPDGPRAHPVRLDLGASTIIIDPGRLPRVGLVGAGPPRPGDAPTGVGQAGEPSGWPLPADHPLTTRADRDPLAKELVALLAETADTVAALLTYSAGDVPTDGVSSATTGIAAGTGTAGTVLGAVVGRGAASSGGPAAAPVLTGADDLREEPGGAGWTATLRVSTAAMPYLLDHALTPQAPGWPDLADRRPVVAATTTVRLMADYAQRASGRTAVGVYDVRFDDWLPAEPATDVAVTLRPEGPDRYRVTFAGYASGLVRLADAYPMSRPPRWPVDADAEQPPAMTGRDMYRERWMFHGPAFQGVTTFLGHGPSHVRGVLTGSRTPGALLDTAGQLIGYWVRMRESDRFLMFPVRIGGVEFFGPEPAPGSPVACHVWVRQFDNEWAEAYMQLAAGNQVWANVYGWVNRRFDLPVELDEAFRWPERRPFADLRPGGWVMATERWSDLAVREMVLSRYIGSAERAQYDALPPGLRREWLLRRIAIKDAVRVRLWGPRHPAIFPAQIEVSDPFGPTAGRDGTGRRAGTAAGAAAGLPVTVSGAHGFPLAPFEVRVASVQDLAVALAVPLDGPTRGGHAVPGWQAAVGLAIEPVAAEPSNPAAGAATWEAPAGVDPNDPWWRCRLAAVTNAAARAAGVDASLPRVTAAARAATDRDTVTAAVTADGTRYSVSCVEVATSPPGLPARGYVVAWTTGARPEHDERDDNRHMERRGVDA
ncbi:MULTISPECIES: type I polyketide synthase [unclassified Pseudofrankia]|uniref:type I polyketide synthase n=1 Tax=unclassified Pseudofrankia TaxID=2994372 RepID=UPI0008D9EEE3|nr:MULTISPECIES: type I polyketide synthase [unclassified Pseudofrankia]MDT3442964.1 type I polyketide synthase [Pseudofrankia sp. BMG5.37]OHV42997.1 beta-ketoacyl synthase [Pseudofrankia sp. BMG5.36]